METLDERRKKILCAIIQSHIDFNVPIGSFFITRKFSLGLSSASIRNIMAKLEEHGYITQPHTSAGRVPTEKGYRFYVNSLLEEKILSASPDVPQELSSRLVFAGKNNVRLVEEAAKTLSMYSHCLAIAIPPKTEDIALKRIKFIKYENRKALVVLISEEGSASNRIIAIDKAYSQKQLDKVAHYLNSKFRGLTLKEIRGRITEQLYKDKTTCDQLVAELVALCREIIFSETDELALNVLGASNLTEFATMRQIREILKAIEDRQFMLKLLNQISNTLGTQIFVGVENVIPALKELSMVVSTYKNRKYASGAIGIIGPTSMNYKKLIPVVDYTAKALTNILSE